MSEIPWWHEPDPEPALGSAAEEAVALFAAVRDRFLSDPATMAAGMRIVDTVGSLVAQFTSATPSAPGTDTAAEPAAAAEPPPPAAEPTAADEPTAGEPAPHRHTVPAGDAPECEYCPVCQGIRRLREVDPDTVTRLTSVSLELAETVRRLVVPPVPGGQRVRHVPLDDDDPAAGPDTGAPGR